MTYRLTEYGVDRHMAVNHIDHVILASHLLPLLKSTASFDNTVRISVQCSNALEMSLKDTKFASPDELNQDLGPNQQYSRSKLAGILYVCYLTPPSTRLPSENPRQRHPPRLCRDKDECR